MQVVGSSSRSNEKFAYFLLTVTSVCLYSTKIYLNGQDHLKVKVIVSQCQDQVKGNNFFVYF